VPGSGGDRDVGPHVADRGQVLGRSMRVFGGVPTYWLTDNERTITIDHVVGMAVRHPSIVQTANH